MATPSTQRYPKGRRTWITGQVIYILAATLVYLLFVLICTVFFSMRQSFTANMWSPTAAILGYTNAGKRVAIPALVKTLEMSWPSTHFYTAGRRQTGAGPLFYYS